MYRVAMLEDDEIILCGLSMLVRKINPLFGEIETFSSGAEAARRFQEEAFDLFITDIEMPQMNGLQTIEQLQKQHTSLLSVIVTGYDYFDYVREALRHGAMDFLLKPVDELELKDVLDKAAQTLQARKLKPENANALAQKLVWTMHHKPADMGEQVRGLREKYSAGELLWEDLSAISRHLADQISGFSYIEGTGVWTLLEQLCAYSAAHKRKNETSALVSDALRYIDQHLTEDMTVATLANVFHITPAYFGQIFLKVNHQTVNSAINTARIRRAKELLTQTQLSIAEISDRCGYKSIDHFYRQFKRLVAQTPAEYRNRNI